MAAILYALSAALSWGVGDFSSGLAARRVGPAHTLLLSFYVGAFSLLVLAIATNEPFPASRELWLGALAGFAGLAGFFAMLHGFTVGRISIVSPVSALLAAAVPVLFTALVDSLPKPLQLFGFSLAFLSIWLLSRRNEKATGPSGVLPALLAGFGFGLFFILIGQLPAGSLFWPLAVGRLVAIGLLATYFVSRRQTLWPPAPPLALLALAGVLDALGNLFFVLSVQAGRLDITSVLVSLGPAVTVLLARVIVKETLTRWQVAGVLLAITATVLVSL
ncbi:MAG: DMT family transporter [Anaerolineales bacterium]|nr:DMT family transporter [Anaerolineales bacterium]